jgi:hypothetical protein
MGFSEIHFIFPFSRFLIFSLIVNCFLARLNCQLKPKVMKFFMQYNYSRTKRQWRQRDEEEQWKAYLVIFISTVER